MIILAFSNKTSKKIPQIVCRKYKHVAPIIPNDNKLIMYQFVKSGHVEKIQIHARDLKILQTHGWDFVYLDGCCLPHDFDAKAALTCVQMTKQIIKMRNIFIQTPFALYKKLKCTT